MTSSLGSVGLAVRAASAFRGGLIMLGVVVLVATTALTAWPRFANTLLTSDLQYGLEQAQPVNRDLVTVVKSGMGQPGSIIVDDPGAAWKAMPGALDAVRRGMTAPLRQVTEKGEFSAASEELPTSAPSGASSDGHYFATVEAYQQLRGVATLDAGAWPDRATVATPSTAPRQPVPDPAAQQAGIIVTQTGPPVNAQVVMTTAAAKLVGWTIGQSRILGESRLTLVGTVTPRDPAADFWNLDTVRASGSFADLGDAGKKYSGVVWVAADSWPTVARSLPGTVTEGWFPVDPAAFSVDRLDAVSGALGRFLATTPTATIGGVPTALRFSTQLDRSLAEYTVRAQPAATLFAILAAGPLGVALAVLVLGVRLVLGRRRDALALMAARGASPSRLRWGLAAEGAGVSIPAAALGLVAALLLTPRGGPAGLSVALAVCCAVAPPLILSVAAGALGPRDDLRGERAARRRWGWVLEVLAVGLAVAGVVTLFQRGTAAPTQDAGLGIDPLLAVTPILIALAACVLVLRLYPLPLGWLAALLRRRRGAVAAIGSTTAVRSRAGGLWPVFALVAGVSITVFSAAVLSTERAGIEGGAHAAVGADLSVSTPVAFTDDQLDRLRSVPGVAHSAIVYSAGGLDVRAGTQGGDLSGYLVDPKELAAVEANVPENARVSTALRTSVPGRTAAVIGGWSPKIPVTSAILYTDTTVHLGVTAFSFTPGVYIRDAEWTIIDKTGLPSTVTLTQRPSTVLVALRPGADAAAVHAAIASVAGPGATIGDAVEQQSVLRKAPLVSGLETVALVSIALSALMCIGALLLTLVMNTASRTRLVATLRTIGFTGRQTAGLLGWELGPVLVVGLIAGILVGLALPAVVLTPIDLTGFTGGPVRPAVVVDPVLIAGAAVGFAVVTAAATLIALAGARRRSPATVLRAGGEE